MKVQSWDREQWKKNLDKRLNNATRFRHQYERVWRENEKLLFTDIGQYPDQIVVTEENLLRFDTGESEVGQDQIGMNYLWKYQRFIHSQMSANPPSVMVRPASTDIRDRKKADAADRIVRHLIRKMTMQEIFDQANLNALTYGNGYIKTVWNPLKGELKDFNEATNEIDMEGEIDIYSIDPWNVWLDHAAKSWKDVRFTFERKEIPVDEAKSMWPDQAAIMDRYILVKPMEKSELKEEAAYEEVVEVYEYYEKGLPINGMAGRHAYHVKDGTVLGEPGKNPMPNATLPIHVMGDSDVPNNVYNKSFVEYVTKIQDFLNRLDSTIIDNIEAHAVVRLVLPEGAELEDESLSNSAWDYVKMTGAAGQSPHFVSPPTLMPDLWRFREQALNGMMELAGVNDSMLGNIKREMSGFSIQTAIDAGNTVRRRLFNKYTLFVENVYKCALMLAREHWDETRTIQVLGKERAFETKEYSKADIDGGFDIVAEYGASLSLDPARRREEIQQLKPDLKEAGISPRTILGLQRLNELDTIYDRVEQAALRQGEIFDLIIEKEEQVEPEDLEDHGGMLEYAHQYVMSGEYRDLKDDVKALIQDHVRMREQMAAQVATQGQVAPPGGMGAAPGLVPPPEGGGAPLGEEELPPLEAIEGGG